MKFDLIVKQLSNNKLVFENMLANVSEEQARWKPSPSRWSLLEVMNHLYDLEKEDFRKKLDMVLYKPGIPWSSIDVLNWVSSRAYNKKPVLQSYKNLLNERVQSINWLNSLRSPNWDSEYKGTRRMRAGDLLYSWAAHDFIHIKQMADLLYEYMGKTLEDYSIEYAGTLD